MFGVENGRKAVMEETFKEKYICWRLNRMLDIKGYRFERRLNKLLTKLSELGYEISWDTQIFKDCKYNFKRMRKLLTETNDVHFHFYSTEKTKGFIIRYKKHTEE